MRPKLPTQYVRLESLSGILLFVMALLAMISANSPLAFIHEKFIATFLFPINEGLMALFFLLVGLELKREFATGQLSAVSQVALPAFAAFGGMLMPACLYCFINQNDALALKGWATPVATDIAFALGVLSLFASRIPRSLKLFLLALAIFDDLGAIVIIALFYSDSISYLFLLLSFAIFSVLYLLSILKVHTLLPYLLLGVGLWLCMLHSGIHPTIAGVLLSMTIPVTRNESQSPLHRLEKALHPWVAFLIMPLFAFANAGFSLSGVGYQALTSGVVLGIAGGLFLGKQIGVFGFSWLLVRLRGAKLPEKSSWLELYGVALLCGIGFTMSLFLGTLSFQNEAALYLTEVRVGVLLGSFISGLMGAVVLLLAKESAG